MSDALPNSSRPDALDLLEARALGLLDTAKDAGAWDDLLEQIRQIEADEQKRLYSPPPPIDPSEGRRSSSELRALIAVLSGAPPMPPPARTRAGYALEGTSGDTQVLPAFVRAVGMTGRLRSAFPDLWAVDAELWQQLGEAKPRELARLWLESPGRRFVQDIGALAHTGANVCFGATDLSTDRILTAAGVPSMHAPDAAEPRAWCELHRAIPGTAMAAWEPEPRGGGEQVVQALRLLENGSPFGVRGAALTWLLNRAVKDPFYSIADGVRRDLRDELPIRLSTALASWLDTSPDSRVSRDLETLTLLHSARIMADDSPGNATQNAWDVARWLQGCLRRSPFFGSDEETLAAHLRSLLRSAPPSSLEGVDALHPARFTLDDSGLDAAEIAFMSGVLAHYAGDGEEILLPTPIPIVHALQSIAKRRARAAEEDADAALAAGRNALGWPIDYSISPPLAARKLMTNLKIGWIGKIGEDEQRGEEAQIDAIDRFARDPEHNQWLAFALLREGQRLGTSARTRAVTVFKCFLHDNDALPPHILGTFGAGLLDGLDDDGAHSILALASVADALWRPFVADAVAGAAERLKRAGLWEEALEQLLALMADETLKEKPRLNATLFALQRASGSKLPGRNAFLGRVAALAANLPFSSHLGLRRELRRLGLSTTGSAEIKR